MQADKSEYIIKDASMLGILMMSGIWLARHNTCPEIHVENIDMDDTKVFRRSFC